jgi:hypothetical protein
VVPLAVGFARLFAALFELPFQRYRGWAPVRQAVIDRLRRQPGHDPGAVPAKSS